MCAICVGQGGRGKGDEREEETKKQDENIFLKAYYMHQSTCLLDCG